MLNLEKRKLPRFHITPCQFHQADTGKNFAIQDISIGGLAIRLVDRNNLAEFAVASKHSGLIKVEGKKLPGTFQVKYIRGTLIGAEWFKPDPALIAHLVDISHPEKLGAHLKKYELPDFVSSQWFHNPVGVDLLFYPSTSESASSTSVGRWTLYIHNSFVQWEIDTGVRTGQALAEDEEGYTLGIVRLETRLIEYDERPDSRLVETARALVLHAPITDARLKNLVLNHLNGVEL